MTNSFPKYEKIVAAVPHCVPDAKIWDWSGIPAAVAWRDRWTDWFTDELFAADVDGLSIVKSTLSRLECDCERLEHESDRICHWAVVAGGGAHLQTVEDNPARCNLCLAEWHRYRAALLNAANADRTLIVDCHSFPSSLAPEVDICLGFNDDGSKPEVAVVAAVERIFRDAGYSVAMNHPYSNAIAPSGYAGHSLMIEVNKQTYLNELTLGKNDGFAQLKSTIESVYRTLL